MNVETKKYLLFLEKTQRTIKNRGFEPKLAKKNSKISYKATKKGLKPLFFLVSNLCFQYGAVDQNRTDECLVHSQMC